jgi:hypothetical protein
VIWTGVLTVLVVAASRSLPTSLVVLLLPYLVLVAWHLLAQNAPRPTKLHLLPLDSGGAPRAPTSPEVVACTPTGGSDERVEASNSRGTNIDPVDPHGSPPVETRRVRGRRRSKPMPPAVPVPVPWVQVGPGRYVRGEVPDPAHHHPAEPSLGDVIEAATPEAEKPSEAVPEEGSRVLEGEDSTADPGGSEEVGEGDRAGTDQDPIAPSDETDVVLHCEGRMSDEPEGG